MKSNRILYKTTQVKKFVTASVLLLVPVLITACAASGETAATLPVTATSVSPSPTQKQPTESSITESVSELDYVAFGDSRTRGTTWPDIWIKSIEADLGVKVNFNNWAFNGQPSEKILSKLRENEKVKKELSEAEIVTVFTSDQIGIEMFTFNRYLDDCPNEVYKSLLEEIVEEIFSLRGDNSTIVRMIEHYNFPGVTERSLVHFEAKNRCTKVYNEIVHSVGDKYGIPVLPLYEALNGPDGNENPGEKGYLRDGVHTNPSGDAVIADLLRDLGYDPVHP